MKTRTTVFQWVLQGVSVLSVLAMFMLVIVFWDKLPDKIPIHYTLDGQVDGWGGKTGVLVSPIAALVLFVVLTLIEQFPQAWNTAVRVTPQNAPGVYHETKNLLISLKCSITVFCLLFTVTDVMQLTMSVYMAGVFIAIIVLPMVVFLIRLVRASKA